MLKIETSDIKSYKKLLVFVLIVSGLYNIGYWSTFKINILSYLDINGLITSFIFPFLLTVGGVLIGLFFTDFFSSAIHISLPYGGYKDKVSKKYKIVSFIIHTIFTVIMVLFILFAGIDAWLFCSLFGWAIYSVFIINYLIRQNIIAHEKLTIQTVQLSILILILAFSVGKYNSLKIHRNIEFDYILQKENIDNSRLIKLIGKAGDHYFFCPIDNNSKIILTQDKSEILEMYHFDSKNVKTKTDSTIMKKILAITKN